MAGVLSLSSLAAAAPLFLSQTVLAVPTAAYNGIPATYPPSFPSLGYEATSTKEFGDEVQLAGVNRELNNVAVSLTDWACQNDYTKANSTDACTTTPGTSFTHPITVNIYSVGAAHTVGTLLATTTQNVAVPYRPSANPTCANSTQWKASDGNCYSGFAFTAPIDFSTSHVTLPNNVIITVAYNTQHYGSHPLNVAGPYNSLNVSLATVAPTVGTDVNNDVMFWNTSYAGFYSDNGAGGTGTLRADTNWSPYSLAVTINADTAVTPVPTSPKFFKGNTEVLAGSTLNAAANVNTVEFKWAASGADQYQTQITYPNGHASRTVWTGSQNVWIGETSGSGWSNNNFFGQYGDGTYTYSVTARSATTGLWSNWSTPVSLVYDNTKPTVTLTSPTTPVVNNTTNLVIKATDNIGLNIVVANIYKVGVSGVFKPTQASAVGLTSYTHTASLAGLPDGDYYVKFNATDMAGNLSSTVTYNFTIDSTAPVGLTHISPVNGTSTTTANLTGIDWTDATDMHGPVSYFYESSLSSATNSNGSFISPAYQSGALNTSSISAQGTPAGVYYWHVRAVDSLNNTTAWTSPWMITVDNTAPTATLVFPTPGPSSTSFEVHFSEAVKPTEAENAANYFLENWPGAGGSGNLSSHATVVYNQSTHIATVTFTSPGWYLSAEQKWGVENIHDLAGNLLNPSPTSQYSTPLVNPTTPGNPTTVSPTKSTSLNWAWTAATDPGGVKASGVKGYYYTLTKGTTTVVPETYTTSPAVTTNVPNQGTYTLHVYTIDNAGNTSPVVTGEVLVDTDAPVVHLTSPTVLSVGHNSTVTINGTTDDATAYELSINGVSVAAGTNFTSGFNWNTAGLPSGDYTVLLTATDSAGNTGSDTLTIKVDNTAPAIDYSGSNVNGNAFTPLLTLSGYKDFSWAPSLSNPVGVTIGGASLTPTFTVTNNGNYLFTLSAADEFGNVSNLDYTFSYTAPITTLLTVSAGLTPARQVTVANQAVLGASTTSPDKTSNPAAILGAATNQSKTTKSSFAWYWWILIVIAIGIITLAIRNYLRRADTNKK